ncbi:MAG: glutamine--fructose-6-phosphate transaminase (isomerizing) [Balneola sp.]|nr:glutamine--fructose-6-phosphate transaminase (isomerizing) [Balneola sp.]MBO6650002.1 glutamine--fructose-6-phosphate transaminase (isomerizing) [Balneola sp.]MBO6711648.1 glutamine--fructose-6-phosphate transaminase (isomerizing) [Balneola sp.]MBO6799844.1 glutamine--fructose-6-phosphate transaminase (isomerizing) [Balneola sp.]MBO6871087.1 glutamine--fructose-6-phosphate transaminase (isomerizing) [Balneola sp.]
MCGIVGYIGNKRASEVIIKGLKRLEYRGYDSAGMALFNGKLDIKKGKGKVAKLEALLSDEDHSTIGIGHTRWATHGEPNDINSHPHTSSSEKLALVHNGIIENYNSLKKVLESKGHTFYSQTDTEVLAKLIEDVYSKNPGDFKKAVQIALAQIEGTYGVAIIHADYPDQLIVARKGSPLLLGVGKGEMLVASDASAVAEYTDQVVYLDDGEIAVIKKDEYQVHTLNDDSLIKEVHELALSLEEIEKGGYEFFMHKEIFEQPKAISDCLRGRLDVDSGTITLGGIKDVMEKIADAKRLVIAACGTSWHSGIVGEYLFESLAKVSVEVEYASELRYKESLIGEGDVMIVISQSGETADTLAALRQAKENGALVIGVVNVVGSSIARETDAGVYIHAGPEIGVASTKAFTGQVTVLTLMAIKLAQYKGTISEEKANKLIKELSKIPSKIEQILEKSSELDEVSNLFSYAPNFLYLGRSFGFPVALEGALKLKEISYIHAEGYPAAEMKHGPIALIDEMMPVVVIAGTYHTNDKMVSNIEEVRARKGRIISIITEGNEEVENLSEFSFSVPETEDELSPLLTVIPLQILSYNIAVNRGCDVDQPRNLAKSVTVE